jgi:hypothetical protein
VRLSGQMLEFTGLGCLTSLMSTATSTEIRPGRPDIPNVLEILAQNEATARLEATLTRVASDGILSFRSIELRIPARYRH